MDPDELTPEERWDRIVELLAIMSMPETPVAKIGEPVLRS